MTIREIRLFGDPVLKSRATEVTDFDDGLAALIDDLFDTMDAAEGVGLAANQIGILKRVFVFDCLDDGQGFRGHIINPVWSPAGQSFSVASEGCLSIPDVRAEVSRYESVEVSGQDKHGEPMSFTASGLLARCVQHETDHLDGVMFLQRLDPAERKAAMRIVRASDWFMN